VCQASVCGNGILEGGEQCDDGNRVGTDLCRNDCTINLPANLPSASCGAPLDIPINARFSLNTCGRANSENNIVGPVDCATVRGNGGDYVFRFTLTRRSTVRVRLVDNDSSVAIDTLTYLRAGRCTADAQVVCSDDVPCAPTNVALGACVDGQQPRLSDMTAVLDAGTYFVVMDHINRRLNNGQQFGCGVVQLTLETL
jgi:cysteine-rich repeat protein